MRRIALILALIVAPLAAQQPASYQERDFLTRIRRLTVEGKRAGEGYWSPDGTRIVFQSEREPGNPFYQIYTLNLSTGDSQRISPGLGKTTCAFFRPGTDEIEFASTHADPKSKQWQDEELAFRASGKERRYSWDYDPEMDIYSYNEKTKALKRLTNARGYDAEGSYSPDGQWLVFSSMRDAYNRPLNEREKKQLEENPSYFAEIYIMRADGSDQRRLTNVPGYDGGPFFTHDGSRIVWRRFDEQGLIADVWTMKPDGSDQRQITDFGSMSWAPYEHPSGPLLHLLVQQARLRELRAVHGRRRGQEGAGAGHLLRWLRRTAGAVARRQDAGVDVEPVGRIGRSAVPGAVEPREGAGGARARAGQEGEQEAMTRERTAATSTRRHEIGGSFRDPALGDRALRRSRSRLARRTSRRSTPPRANTSKRWRRKSWMAG